MVRIDPRVGLPIVVVLLGVAVWRVASYVRDEPGPEQAPAQCSTCEHEFVPEPGEASPTCPECGTPVDVRLFYFRCNDCGEVFVGYEFKPAEQLIREPDGEWMPRQECTLQRPCPNCDSDKTYFAREPGAARRSPKRNNE